MCLSVCWSIYHLCHMNAYLISRPKLHCHPMQSNGVIDSFITRQGWISIGDSKAMAMVTSSLRVLYVQIFLSL